MSSFCAAPRLFLLVIASILLVPGLRAEDREGRPNIVIIYTDDQGYGDVGTFGAEGFTTPHLDQLAEEGVAFRNFHVAQPVCSASRAALLTGCYPNRLGIHGALGPRSRNALNADEMTLAELVKQRGYATAIFGKWHLGHTPEFLPTRHGFDTWFGLPYSNDMWPFHPEFVNLPPDAAGRKRGFPDLPLFEDERVVIPSVTAEDQTQLTTWYTDHAVRFIHENRERPFLLYLAHSMPHVPLFVSDKFRGKSEQGLYGDVIMEIDWSVGEVMAALDRCGLTNDTWIIFASDNGPWLSYRNHAGSAGPLREGKGTCWEGGTRVPCIMRWPGKIPAGKESRDMLMTIDLLPTIAGRIGAELPEHKIDGLDVWPLIAKEAGATNPHSSYWFYYQANQLQGVTSGDGRWQLQLPHTYRTMEGQKPGGDGSPGRYRQVQIKKPELYDLHSDLGQTKDVSAEHPEVVQSLLGEAEKARAELGDALTKRKGSGHRPPGRVGQGAAKKPETILFVGNSFTYGAGSPVRFFRPDSVTDLNGTAIGGVPALFKAFTAQAGLKFDVSLETMGGSSLKDHLARKAEVVAHPWDHVVMQSYSTLNRESPGDPASLIESTKQLSDLLHQKNPKVAIWLKATWPRADQVYPESGHWHGRTLEAMTTEVRAGYDRAAAASPSIRGVIPVGEAWHRSMTTGVADPNPYDGVAFGQFSLWTHDHYHASTHGCYLSALTVFGKITGLDPRSLGRTERCAFELGLSETQAAALQQVAQAQLTAEEPEGTLKTFTPVVAQ